MKNFQIRTLKEEHYPLALGDSIYKPKKLHILGDIPKSGIGIAMVGTRRPGRNAESLCRRLVHSLSGTKAIVISGLAQGIDSLCHEAAINEGIPTVAVLAQGLATKIEGSRGTLARRILESGGALISTFDDEEPAYKGNFIARNKIITGLSQATLVVQSKDKGGALITADFCIREGKKLFAVPGDFDNEVYGGTNALLDSGHAQAIFQPESLSGRLGLPKAGGETMLSFTASGCTLSEAALAMLEKENGYRKTFSELQQDFDMATGELLAILTELELSGFASTTDNFQFYFNRTP